MKRRIEVILAAVVLLAALPLAAQTSAFVTFTDHSEEALTWCGPATAQMLIGGYPTSACNVDQSDVNASIQAHRVEAMWDSDPAGMIGALMDHALCPSTAHWVVASNTNAPSIMHSVAYWMNTNHYPAAVLLNTVPHNAIAAHAEHWVAVKGIVTDLDPRTNTNVTLQYVLIVDPSPATFGGSAVERFMSGAQFYAEYMNVSLAGSTYLGKYVALIEPPEKQGTAIAKLQAVTGRIIPPARAQEAAQRAVQRDLPRAPSFREAANLRAEKPILVSGDRGAYYIVPLAGAREAAVAVLINAYTGEFMEAGRFNPHTRLTEGDVIERAARAVRRAPAAVTKPQLVAPRGASPYFPLWRVTVEGQPLLIDPEGRVRMH